MTSTDPGRRSTGGRAPRSEDRRAQIVTAALDVIAEYGYERTTQAAVAERVGLTQQGLQHHFPSKEDLFVAVLEARDQWDNAATALTSSHLWPLEMYAQLVEYNATRPRLIQVFTILAAESLTEDHPARQYFKDRYRGMRERATAMLRAACGDTLPSGLTPSTPDRCYSPSWTGSSCSGCTTRRMSTCLAPSETS